jgi:hypothetical protein
VGALRILRNREQRAVFRFPPLRGCPDIPRADLQKREESRVIGSEEVRDVLRHRRLETMIDV